jgi:L-lysine 2,3-aminomutase
VARGHPRSARELLSLLGLGSQPPRFPTPPPRPSRWRVPRAFAARMRHGDASDPLLRQVLPIREEEMLAPGFSFDAVGDFEARAGAGLLHKYQGRALLITTGSCA